MVATQITLWASILLCSLVAGLVFGFAIVVMPGIRTLQDRDFLRAFAVMDRVIQNNQPAFIFVWIGSAISVVVMVLMSIWHLDGVNQLLGILLSAAYLAGVQLPTITINIPLNNRLQSMDLDNLSPDELAIARSEFETKWVYWNSARTIVATLVTAGLVILALRM